jgi:hypothetical protein
MEELFQQIVELLFRILLNPSIFGGDRADQIWDTYMHYRTQSRGFDIEKDFLVGNIMLALGEFGRAIDAMQYGLQHASAKQLSVRHYIYLTEAYLAFLRYHHEEANGHIPFSEIKKFVEKVEKSCKKHPRVIASAYEAASRRSCSGDLTRDERKEMVEYYFKKARDYYEKAGECPQEFKEWQEFIEKERFCSEE